MRRSVLLASAWLIVQSNVAFTQRQQASPASIESRVEALLARMTVEEKIGLIAGGSGFDIPGLDRLGIRQLNAADSPFGVRATGPSTLYAAGINLAATFNPELARLVGTQLGRDARARGRQYSLGPGVNIYRSPLNGRNFEYYGEDPFLAGRIAVGFINGVQSQGVSSTIKHFLGNNSEFGRNTTDSRIDERALREIYLPAFEAAVKEAHTGAIMGSYNLTNGLYMTENRRLIRDVLKGEWSFDGVYMSDWFATHDAIAAATRARTSRCPRRCISTASCSCQRCSRARCPRPRSTTKFGGCCATRRASVGWTDACRTTRRRTTTSRVRARRSRLRGKAWCSSRTLAAFSPSTEPNQNDRGDRAQRTPGCGIGRRKRCDSDVSRREHLGRNRKSRGDQRQSALRSRHSVARRHDGGDELLDRRVGTRKETRYQRRGVL